MKKQTCFYLKANATWKDSSRRKGGYFSYSDMSVKNCLIEVAGNDVTIYENATAYGLTIYRKKMHGKYFSFTGKKVTERTFKKHLSELQKMADTLKAERIQRQETADQSAKKELQEITEKIKSILPVEKVSQWSQPGANEGNAHTRRTRWSNRAQRMGFDRGYGGLLRDIVTELSGVQGQYWVNGVYNPAHL